MKRSLFLSFLLVITSVFAYAKGYETIFSQPSSSEYQISFELKEWSLANVVFDGVEYQKIIFNSSTVTEEKGWAELPFVSASIQLPAQKNVDLRIIYKTYTDYHLDYPLVPSRGAISRSQSPSAIPYEIDPASIIDSFYPNQLAIAEDPFIIRDVRGTAVRLFPFHYNAVTKILRVYNQVDVLLTENDEPAINPLVKENTTPVKEVIGMYQSIFLNYNTSKVDLAAAEYGEILLITTDRDSETIDTYIQWKKEKGYVVHKEIVAVGTNVKSLIQDKYNANNNILYVQLVGDWADIKCDLVNAGMYGIKPGDAEMGCVVGNDYYPEMAIGRFSCSNASQLHVQINKAIEYEKNPNMDPNWRESYLAVAGNETGGDDGESDKIHIGRIYSQRLEPFTYNTIYENYQPTSLSVINPNITSQLNSGVSTLAFCAHGSTNGFYFNGTNGGTVYNNTNVSQLVNGNKLPFIVASACNTGEFNITTDCFAETWLKKENGGAIVVLMSSISQPWTPPMRGQDYFYDILSGGFDYSQYAGQNGITTTEQRTTWGSIVVNIFNLMLSESNYSADYYTTRTWNTFGDVSLQLRTKQPDVITSSTESFVSEAPFSTIISANGNPVKDALVCVSQNGVYHSAFTNANGEVTIEHGFTSGDVLLVVTAFNTTTIYEVLEFGETTNYTVSASTNPDHAGTVSGEGIYISGATATLTAIANTGYDFVNWTENGSSVSTDATYSFSVTGNRTLIANFELKNYTITARTNPSVGGIANGSGSYNHGSTVTLTAIANTGYDFVNWTENGSSVSTDATYSFSATDNRTLIANFEEIQLPTYFISATTNPASWGDILPNGVIMVTEGDDQTFVITTRSGYEIIDVIVDGKSKGKIDTYTFENVTSDHTIVAEFDATIGIEESRIGALKIYPNPANDIVRVESKNADIQKIQVYDIVGSLVYERDAIRNTETTIDMSNFISGIYFINVDSHILKVIKK